MRGKVVSNAGPLIALARVPLLDLLEDLYGSVFIPLAVEDELRVDSERPGARRLSRALNQGWLEVHRLSDSADSSLSELNLILDAGEAEAIVLAEEISCRFLLIDDRRGRSVAKRRGIPVAGVAAVLLASKESGLVDAVLPVLRELAAAGYRLSSTLIHHTARLAGEAQTTNAG